MEERGHHTPNVTHSTSHTPHHTHPTSHTQHHTPNITHSTSHTQQHTPDITPQHHTPNITNPTSHTQHHTLNISHLTSHTQHHTLNITHSMSHTAHRTPGSILGLSCLCATGYRLEKTIHVGLSGPLIMYMCLCLVVFTLQGLESPQESQIFCSQARSERLLFEALNRLPQEKRTCPS